MGTLEWARINDWAERYVVPSVLFFHLALWVVAIAPLQALARKIVFKRLASLVSAAPVAVAAVLSYGFPSLAVARSSLDHMGRLTKDLIEARATHVAGSYWSVWPAVFHSSLVLAERGEAGHLWGLTHRSWATSEGWRAVPAAKTRIAAVKGEDEAGRWLKEYGFKNLVVLEERATVVIYGLGQKK